MRGKEKTPEEELLEKTINLSLAGLEIKEEWDKVIKEQESIIPPINKIFGKIGGSIVKLKCFIDDCLGEERAKKIHDFISKIALGI